MAVEESRTDYYPKPILYSAAALSLLAASIHLWVTPEHFEEWWGYGVFFLAAAIAQGAYGGALLCWPRRALLLLGIGGNLSIVVLYLVTRAVGIPFFGPEAGEVEATEATDLCATTSELALVVALGAMLLQELSPQRRRWSCSSQRSLSWLSGTYYIFYSASLRRIARSPERSRPIRLG